MSRLIHISVLHQNILSHLNQYLLHDWFAADMMSLVQGSYTLTMLIPSHLNQCLLGDLFAADMMCPAAPPPLCEWQPPECEPWKAPMLPPPTPAPTPAPLVPVLTPAPAPAPVPMVPPPPFVIIRPTPPPHVIAQDAPMAPPPPTFMAPAPAPAIMPCICNCSAPTGVAYGDPHFYGKHGEHFDFHGRSGRDYCVVTDKEFHINMHLFQGLQRHTTVCMQSYSLIHHMDSGLGFRVLN
jgi:hypothetical protein